MPSVRLNKRLADLGLASRRGAEELILAGKVKVNGVVVTELATKVDPDTDKVEVDAAALQPQGPLGYLLNKPVGYVCTKGEEEGPTILDLLPPPAAGMAYAGRLDKDSRGLVLMLADGRLNYALTAPETHLEKEYEILAETEPKESQLLRMAEGMTLDGERTRPARVEPIKGKRFRLGITEGKNRQIRRMCSKVGIEVMDLCRLAIGPLELGDLPEGKWKELSAAQAEMLRRSVKKRP